MGLRAPLLASLALLASCSSLLPTTSTTQPGRWSSYSDAEQTFAKIVPHQTTALQLQEMRLDPESDPNIAILNYAEVARRFLPDTGVKLAELDVGIQECIGAKTRCTGLEVTQMAKAMHHEGNFFLDTLGFRRDMRTLGWSFQGLLLVKDGVVIYKFVCGQPAIQQHEETHNWLGPLQGIGKKILGI